MNQLLEFSESFKKTNKLCCLVEGLHSLGTAFSSLICSVLYASYPECFHNILAVFLVRPKYK